MTTGALTDIVLDEAEAIVRAEWLRLQRNAPRAGAHCAECSEMPAARTRILIGAAAGTPRPPSPSPPRRQAEWAPRRGAQRRVRPTQRSPPDRAGHGEQR
jgi:hypothetical protein